MPEKRKEFRAVKFSVSTLRSVEAYLWELDRPAILKSFPDTELSSTPAYQMFEGTVADLEEEWTFDTPVEWSAAYRRSNVTSSSYDLRTSLVGVRVRLQYAGMGTAVQVSGPTRQAVEAVFEMFEDGAADGTVSREVVTEQLPAAVPIFIGHGRSGAWRDLKDRLTDKHGFTVIAYEVGARGGMSIQEVLQDMVSRAGFALLVHTAEDATDESEKVRARQNVVHETGLFQGALGFHRAIILRESGCEGFSNVVGTTELRFDRGRIAEVFGDVLAIIHREYGGAGYRR